MKKLVLVLAIAAAARAAAAWDFLYLDPDTPASAISAVATPSAAPPKAGLSHPATYPLSQPTTESPFTKPTRTTASGSTAVLPKASRQASRSPATHPLSQPTTESPFTKPTTTAASKSTAAPPKAGLPLNPATGPLSQPTTESPFTKPITEAASASTAAPPKAGRRSSRVPATYPLSQPTTESPFTVPFTTAASESTAVLPKASQPGDRPALATHDGITVYEAHNGGGVRVHGSPAEGGPPVLGGNNPALATHDGITVYEAHYNGGVRKSSAVPPKAGHRSTAKAASTTKRKAGKPKADGNYPALATHDGITVYEAHSGGGVRKSTAVPPKADQRTTATRPLSQPTTESPFTVPFTTAASETTAVPPQADPQGNLPALATHDGITVYEAHVNGGVRIHGRIAAGDLPYGGHVTRSADPFAVSVRVYRTENLPVMWERNGDDIVPYVEYAGFKWTCIDGSIVIPPDELPKTISKLDLLVMLYQLGRVDDFMTWLDSSGLKVYWDAAQNMATDHPLFEQGLESVKEALGMTDEEVSEILSEIAK